MNTPAHVVLNLLVVGRGPRSDRPQPWLPVLLGALVPDLPMVVFYAIERGLLGTPEHVVWDQAYFEEGWQLFIDAFNSLPLIGLGLLVAWRRRCVALQLFFLSMGLHAATDLLVHHDDAHRHFLPLSTWRFRSPVSYWDPQHFGQVFAAAEALFVAGGCALLLRRDRPRPVRWVAGFTAAAYVAFAVFAIRMWMLA